MKPINFSSTIPLKEQKSIRRWLVTSFMVIFLTSTVLAIMLTLEVNEWLTLRKEKNTLLKKINTAAYSQKETLTQEKDLLAKRLAKINQSIHYPKNPQEYITKLVQQKNNELQIKNIEINKKNIEFSAQTRTNMQALQCIETLHKTNKFKNLELVSFQSNPSGIAIKVKGMLV